MSEETPAGVTAADLVQFAEADETRPLTWINEQEGIEYGPEQGSSTISIDAVVADPPRARWVDQEVSADTAQNILVTCPDRVEVDVVVTLSTERGALAETFQTSLIAHDSDQAWIEAKQALEDTKGSLTVSAGSPGSTTELQVTATFDSEGSRNDLAWRDRIGWGQPKNHNSADCYMVGGYEFPPMNLGTPCRR